MGSSKCIPIRVSKVVANHKSPNTRKSFEVFKNVNNEKCVPKMILFNEKNKKIRIILDIEN